MGVDEVSGRRTDGVAEFGVVQNPVQVGVGHLVVPDHDLDAGLAGFGKIVFDGVRIGRVHHDQIDTIRDEVFNLLDLSRRVVIAGQNGVLPALGLQQLFDFAEDAGP